MKQEALSAAISEKDSHLAFLEMSGIKNAKIAEQVDKLKTEKKQLNENRVKLLMDLEDSDLDELISTSANKEKIPFRLVFNTLLILFKMQKKMVYGLCHNLSKQIIPVQRFCGI
ncbi:hypothetical protein CEXT_502071 [Caerostris extrusa]|uniref:Uncharacterized protein n=1 Tax=Caerostris extrusa TaxID=172846 RepID=A0AAV4MXK9_CAEEX|nr:hypothetical protein CEXT_502071 [Caerostris extrusa]